MIDDGVIKFNHVFIEKSSNIPEKEFSKLELIRREIYNLNLIGAYPNGIGYGNLSIRYDYNDFYKSDCPQFLISGTQTGEKENLDGESYTRVVSYDFCNNKVEVIGPIEASSESLTHASIYSSSKYVKSIIHIHNAKMWSGLLSENYPKIPKHISYGTQEMASYASSIVTNTENNKFQLLVMEGHEEGVIFFHEDLKSCLDNVKSVHKIFCS